jgi:transposase-like protein
VRANVVPNRQVENVLPLVTQHIMPASTVFTDEAGVYKRLPKQGYAHHRINHGARVYVKGNVHTQTIEGFWSLLKNGIRGTHHAVGAGYLQSYVNEYVFRYNHRRDAQPMFRAIQGRVVKVRQGRYGKYAPVGE